MRTYGTVPTTTKGLTTVRRYNVMDVVLIGMTYAFAIGLAALLLAYRYFVSEKYLDAEKRLRMKLNEVSGLMRETSGDARRMAGPGGSPLSNDAIGSLVSEFIPPQYRIFAPAVTGFFQGFLSNPDNVAKLTSALQGIGGKNGPKAGGPANL